MITSFVFLIILINQQFLIKSNEIILQQFNEVENSCSNEAIALIREERVLIIHNGYNNINDILKVINKNQNTITLLNLNLKEKRNSDIILQDVFIFAINEIEEYIDILNKFNYSEHWNPSGKFVIFNYGIENINLIFQISWENKLINTILINKIKKDDVIYTYFPYNGNNCNDTKPVKYVECSKIYNFTNLFPEKVPLDMHKCEIKFGATIFAPLVIDPNATKNDPKVIGFETNLMRTFFEKVNAYGNLTFINNGSWGFKYPNRNMTGPFKPLQEKRIEVAYGHMWTNMGYIEDFDVTYPQFYDYSRWYVPKAQRVKQWRSLFVIFELTLWGSIILAFICNVIIWWIFGKLVKDIPSLQDLGLCFIQSLYALCMGSFRLPKKLVMKMLVLNWTFFGLLVAVTYQSKLLTILTSPLYEHQVKNLKELSESSYRVISTAESIIGLKEMNSEVGDWLLKNAEFWPYDKLLKLLFNYDKRSAFQITHHWTTFATSTYFTNPDGTSMIFDLVNDQFLFFTMCVYTTKGFPLLKRFNEIGFRLNDAGFIRKWVDETDTTIRNVKTANEPITLNLNHFMGAFFLLLFGLTFAFIAFFAEIIIYKNKHKKQKKFYLKELEGFVY